MLEPWGSGCTVIRLCCAVCPPAGSGASSFRLPPWPLTSRSQHSRGHGVVLACVPPPPTTATTKASVYTFASQQDVNELYYNTSEWRVEVFPPCSALPPPPLHTRHSPAPREPTGKHDSVQNKKWGERAAMKYTGRIRMPNKRKRK